MKTKLLLFALAVSFAACGNEADTSESVEEIAAEGRIQFIIRNPVTANGEVDSLSAAIMDFEMTEYDFGEIDEGGIVQHTFKFTNAGKAPLLIRQARSTCGCTIPEYPEDPIEPGESGEIEVKFDTKGKPGYQSKPVTITANTFPAQTVVTLKGRVNGKK